MAAAASDIQQKLEQNLKNANFFQSNDPSKSTSKSVQNTAIPQNEATEEEKKSEPPVSKPGKARKINVYLVDPERFVIEWSAPKKMGSPLPLHYDIVINDHEFKKVVTQHKKRKQSNKWRVLVFNCEVDDIYKIGIDTYNDKIKGIPTAFTRIKTIIKPSVMTDLSCDDGVITWNPPVYASHGTLKYELVDADDIEEKTILSTESCQIDLKEHYTENVDKKWRIRIKESTQGYHSFSPVIKYNVGSIRCAKFTAAKIFSGDVETLTTEPIRYPKWTPPPKPDILKDITKIELIDKGSYLLVPSELDPDSNDNVLKVLCFSDTHVKHDAFRFDTLPAADIVLHAGDFTMTGQESEVVAFEEWGKFMSSLYLDEQHNTEIYKGYYASEDQDNIEQKWDSVAREQRKYKHLICIAGNHEMTFDVEWYTQGGNNAKRYHGFIKPPPNAQEIKNIIANSEYWTYLEDTTACLYGLNIYGSPWQPYFYNWAFQKSRGNELNEIWQLIPKNTDIVITHGPPFCHGDKVSLDRVRQTGDNREYSGDQMLMKRMQEIGQIQYHVFGHVHAGTGVSKQKGLTTTFVNAVSVNEAYHPRDKPIMFYILKKST
eukprot:345204_1